MRIALFEVQKDFQKERNVHTSISSLFFKEIFSKLVSILYKVVKKCMGSRLSSSFLSGPEADLYEAMLVGPSVIRSIGQSVPRLVGFFFFIRISYSITFIRMLRLRFQKN